MHCTTIFTQHKTQTHNMTTLRRFQMNDLFRFNNVNLDKLTETYNLPYYMQYLSQWPSLFIVAESSPCQSISGYIMGKAEGKGENWHGHVTAVTVAPEYRRLNLAQTFMDYLEYISDEKYKGYFVDLFVRCSNAVAINMYHKFGYSEFRQVIGYYSQEEDAFDMRKALSRDQDKKSVIPNQPFKVHPHDID